jgi:hypothetical protein
VWRRRGPVRSICCARRSARAKAASPTRAGADLSFADGYSGYFITHSYSGGPAYLRHCALTGNLTANLWTRVELRLTRSPATVQVFFNGSSAGTSCSAGFLDDTLSDVSFGMRAFPETAAWTVYYDNVVATVRR